MNLLNTDIDRVLFLLLEQKGRVLTAEEQAELEVWRQADLRNVAFEKELMQEDFVKELLSNWKAVNAQQSLGRVRTKLDVSAAELESNNGRSITLWPRIRIAVGIAAAVATVVFGVWFFAYRELASSLAPRRDDWVKNDVAPGKSGATITLASGEVISLSGEKKGVVIGNGKISYSSSGVNPSLRGTKQASDEIASLPRNDGLGGNPQGPPMMTAATAKGQTYEFTLPDGTHVWLNADSKISFPSQFSGKERKILLEGEAYFAVVHNSKQPFRVESKGQVVEDIGTEFNINAYADEGVVKTTLIEGIAKVNAVTLRPNDQATLSGSAIKVQKVDTELAVAWKNNQFLFEEQDLRSIMRMISRWYNVEIQYAEDVSNEKFGGGVSRFDNVSKVLKSLEETGQVHFKIKGRTIYVSR